MIKRTKPRPMTASEMGRKRWQGVSKAQRSEIAKRAVRAREEKRKGSKNK